MPFKLIEKKPNNKERRKFKRHHTQSTQRVQIKTLGSGLSGEEITGGTLRNNSDGGVCIYLQSPLKRKQVVLISLPFLNEKTTVPTLGEIRWSKTDSMEKEGYEVGISYLL